jgi:AcrR family transcriptional regulator
MYKNCTTADSAQRQRQFETVLLQLMQRDVYQKITVGDLCDSVGVSRNAFYRYFDCKEDVLYALIDHTLTDFRFHEPNKLPHRDTYRSNLEAFLHHWKQCKPLLDALERSDLWGILFQRCLRYGMGRELEIPSDMLRDVGRRRYQVTLFVTNGLLSLVIDWHRSGYAQTIPELMDVIERVLLQPVIRLDQKY